MDRFHVSQWISYVLLSFLTACQSVPYDSHQRLEVEGNFYTRVLKQDNHPVSRLEFLRDMKSQPATASVAQRAEIWTYTSFGLSALGGFLLGFNVVQGNSSGILLGAVAAGGGAGAAYLGDASLMELVTTHNSGHHRGDLDLKLDWQWGQVNHQLQPYAGIRMDF